MAHHGEENLTGMGPKFEAFLRDVRFGATGNFPRGNMGPQDEGEIKIGVTATHGSVVLAFGKEVAWIGFGAEQARDLAQLFLDKARELDGIEARVRRVYDPERERVGDPDPAS